MSIRRKLFNLFQVHSPSACSCLHLRLPFGLETPSGTCENFCLGLVQLVQYRVTSCSLQSGISHLASQTQLKHLGRSCTTHYSVYCTTLFERSTCHWPNLYSAAPLFHIGAQRLIINADLLAARSTRRGPIPKMKPSPRT